VSANAHPLLAADAKPNTAEIVDMLLHGIAAPDRESDTWC